MKIRMIITLAVVGIIVMAVSYYVINYTELEAVAAEPVPVRGLEVQATTLEEVKIREVQAVAARPATFEDENFDYHLVYPLGWNAERVAPNQVVFRAPDGASKVTVEAVGPLAADGLSAFVDRSLGRNIVISRQQLTVHSLPAERVIAYSDEVGGQITLFFIDAGQSAYALTGVGEQKAIEMIARSFNVPQPFALR